MDGKPLTNASIRFTSPVSGAAQSADLNKDGTYAFKLDHTHDGEAYGVSFGPSLATPENAELDEAGIPKSNPLPPLPRKDLEDSSSDLTATIESESVQTFDFNLRSK